MYKRAGVEPINLAKCTSSIPHAFSKTNKIIESEASNFPAARRPPTLQISKKSSMLSGTL